MILVLALAISAAAAPSPSLVDLTREKPTLRVTGGPVAVPMTLDLLNFLLDHPELAAWFARERGISRYSVERKDPRTHKADDHQGARGKVELVERSETSRLYFGEGDYTSGVFPTVHASGAVALSLSTPTVPGCPETAHSGYEVSVRLRSRVLSGMAQPIVPFLRGKVQQKFERIFSVARKVGAVLADDPKGAGAQLRSYEGLSAEERARLDRLLARLPKRPPECR